MLGRAPRVGPVGGSAAGVGFNLLPSPAHVCADFAEHRASIAAITRTLSVGRPVIAAEAEAARTKGGPVWPIAMNIGAKRHVELSMIVLGGAAMCGAAIGHG